jgi:hypothetical protein
MSIPEMKDNPNGLHHRYNVTKANGSPVDENAVYFVLRIDNGGDDPLHIDACREAVLTYAKYLHGTRLAQLARELEDFVQATAKEPT